MQQAGLILGGCCGAWLMATLIGAVMFAKAIKNAKPLE